MYNDQVAVSIKGLQSEWVSATSIEISLFATAFFCLQSAFP